MTDLPSGTIAMLAAEDLDGPLTRSLTAEFDRRGRVHHTESAEFTTPSGTIRAVRWSLELGDSDDTFGTQLISSLLDDAAAQLAPAHVTTTVLPARQRPTGEMLLIMDVDSTLIDQEVIDLLAGFAGAAEEVAEVTERAMRGELDFTQSLHARVATLAGLDDTVLHETSAALTATTGATDLISTWQRRGWPVYAVSGGFRQLLEPLAEQLGLTGFDANTLQVRDGRLTGRTAGHIVDPHTKRQRLLEWSKHHATPVQNVVAVGDGANDADMVKEAGVGVAFCAKPALAEHADLVITHRHMGLIAYAIGLATEATKPTPPGRVE
ncbi:phosphoserine phosphatase SerB [Nesterenkonia sphaerica]|nr:phosphoserine phosphatase SerB [Nesterenkonia sphaerica]